MRDDLADVRLRGIVEAARFVEGRPARVKVPVAPLRRAADATSPRDTEALFGESLVVFEQAAGWAWVQLEADGYVGYLEQATLDDAPAGETTHRVAARSAVVYKTASALSEPVMVLPMNAEVAVLGQDGSFAAIAGGGFVGSGLLSPKHARAKDFVAVAESFLGTPYIYGGKSHIGIDCSGLVQMSLRATGAMVPRDSDMQAAEVGQPIDVGADLEGLKRGDLVFWPGHVAIMVSEADVVHATATWMRTVHEPMAAVAERARKGGPIVAGVRRLAGVALTG
ncbi:MAG: C40 family peptidase [Hyphomicrobiaceae bacterium]|nr:C40 family peptidase [Hyphomicrobiaceae bacterium]